MSQGCSGNKRDAGYHMDMSVFGRSELSPEAELAKAVLLLAIQDLQRRGEKKRRAEAFFLAHETEYLFSFYGICSQLRLDPSKTRHAILNGSTFRFERRRKKFKSELKEAA